MPGEDFELHAGRIELHAGANRAYTHRPRDMRFRQATRTPTHAPIRRPATPTR
jgi:hypothetical protein